MWRADIEALLEQWDPAPRPRLRPGLAIPLDDDAVRVVLCAGPYLLGYRPDPETDIRSPLRAAGHGAAAIAALGAGLGG